MRSLILGMLLAGQAVLAQEVAVYRVNASPGPSAGKARDAGYSAAFTRPIGESQLQFGVRIGFSEARDSMPFNVPCINCTSVAFFPFQIRLRSTEAIALFLPYATRTTRVEMGAGVVRYNFSGYVKKQYHGEILTMTLSRRFGSRLPVWGTVGFAMHTEPNMASWPHDARRPSTPDNSLRFGLVLRR
jgi:hypothetical protein